MVASVSQVSMVMTAWPTLILAAPQQSPVSQVASSLLGLKVPFDMAFSHLAPAAPLAGLAAMAVSTSVSIRMRLAVLVASAVERLAAYLSYWVSLHDMRAARCVAVAALITPCCAVIKTS